MEPVWPAGSVGWFTIACEIYYASFAFYLFNDGKAAEHENDGDVIVFISATLISEDLYDVLVRVTACMTARYEPIYKKRVDSPSPRDL